MGGPYYAEVGKNISLTYTTTANETFYYSYNISNTDATTNETQPYITINQTYSETNTVNKTWTYFQYDPSNVEFYFYKECIVKDMKPHTALTLGGTKIEVIGSWFQYMPEYGVIPHCKFGDKVVRG